MFAIIAVRERDRSITEADCVVGFVDPMLVGQPRERFPGHAPLFPPGNQVVVAPVYGAQPVRQQRTVDEVTELISDLCAGIAARDALDGGAVGLRDLDLFQNKFEIVSDQRNHACFLLKRNRSASPSRLRGLSD
jgi:hypothetical protein